MYSLGGGNGYSLEFVETTKGRGLFTTKWWEKSKWACLIHCNPLSVYQESTPRPVLGSDRKMNQKFSFLKEVSGKEKSVNKNLNRCVVSVIIRIFTKSSWSQRRWWLRLSTEVVKVGVAMTETSAAWDGRLPGREHPPEAWALWSWKPFCLVSMGSGDWWFCRVYHTVMEPGWFLFST